MLRLRETDTFGDNFDAITGPIPRGLNWIVFRNVNGTLDSEPPGQLEPLRQAAKDGLPMFGTCAGMILLADRIEDGVEGQETIGGLDVVVRRNAFGRQVDSFEAELELADFDQPFHAVFIRAPWVEKVGADVEVVARVTAASRPEAVGRIVAVRQAHLLATSFHPEITGDARIHRVFVELVRGRS